ncbi:MULTISPECIES: glycosyltransferase family 2 protein [unclassified Streptomyces]|uniref:glycosyltransferase family 2 protein n=1 Tax=unclassified Streptomyces TaxID=2593676 RepID=UPI000823E60D|nr:glycosyltransferase family 2 protein [Streptomyces sp. AmelKG-D3]MYU02120.1 glycosyltransferase [Streptomyces sp. SID8350]SCK61607.1 Glycosyltransferases involved in cell wall biogenesis [Streptomyces sp. AmelKG-D3]
MSGPPRISCVILCHNYGRYLDRAITSCLEQEPGNFSLHEVIVIDDGSSDETEEVCLRHKDNVKVIRRSQQGFGQTLTDAFLVSTGDWVAPLDADDWFHPSKLRTCAEVMTGEPLFIEHWENVVDSNGNAMLSEPHPGGNTSTLVVHRDAAQSLLPASNEIFFHALREAGRGIALRDPLTFYRVHPRSMTDRSTPGVSQDYRADVCTAISNHLRAMRENPPGWATARQLQKISWHFRTLAFGHRVESAMQRERRLSAMLLIPGMLMGTLRARDPIAPWFRSLSSTIAGRPLVRLTAGQGQQAHS